MFISVSLLSILDLLQDVRVATRHIGFFCEESIQIQTPGAPEALAIN